LGARDLDRLPLGLMPAGLPWPVLTAAVKRLDVVLAVVPPFRLDDEVGVGRTTLLRSGVSHLTLPGLCSAGFSKWRAVLVESEAEFLGLRDQVVEVRANPGWLEDLFGVHRPELGPRVGCSAASAPNWAVRCGVDSGQRQMPPDVTDRPPEVGQQPRDETAGLWPRSTGTRSPPYSTM